MKKSNIFIFSLICIASKAKKDNAIRYRNTTQVLNSLSAPGVYDKRIRPYHEGPPLNISVYITVVTFGAIKEINMEYTLDIFFKQAWNDPRLTHDLRKPILLPGNEKENFWLPDTFFLNVKTAKFHRVPAANSRIVISPNGDIELSERLTVSASCRMDLRDYPLDTQTCVLEILSYSYDITAMDYHWDDEKAVIILDDEMSEFELADCQSERKQVEYVIGTYTHLVAKFVFRRRLAYSFIQIYSPTFLIVVLSWMSFWISKDAVPARVALGITTVLTIVTLMGSLRNSVPKVSYIKAIDSYLIVSFIFVFGVLLEYVAVLMHSERKRANKTKKQKEAKDFVKAEMEIGVSNGNRNSVTCPMNRSQSSYSLPLRPQSTHGFPVRSPTAHCLPHKSVLKNSYSRQSVPGPAIQHSPYTTNPPQAPFLRYILSFCMQMSADDEVDIFDRIARIFFPLSFFVFNIGYYLRYGGRSTQDTFAKLYSIMITSRLFFLWIISLFSCGLSTNEYRNTSQVLTSLSAPGVYDKRIRPYYEGPPLNISVNITVVTFGAIKEINLEYTLDIFFKQAWNDPRLKHDLRKPIILPGKEKDNFWLPDTFFLNVKTAKFHHVPAENSRIVISPNGDIELSQRLTVSASCRMDLRDYPLDTQTCALEILSYSYDINDMDYHWDDERAVIILDDEMSEFELADCQSERKQVEYVIGTYTHLVAKFVFRRRLAYSFIQIYSPTFLIVVLSWMSFWISKDAVPARVALGITTVLTIVTLMGSLRNSVPKVSYIKAIDSYLIVSFIFVFGVLLEYVAVLMHSERKRANTMKKQKEAKDYATAEMEIGFSNGNRNFVTCPVNRSQSSHSLSPWPQSTHGFPVRSPSTLCLPHKSVLKNSHSRQSVAGPAIQHIPYTTSSPQAPFLRYIPSFCLQMTANDEVDIFDRIARIIFPLSFVVFNIGYYLRYR
ncbi:uncharacterized protein LOC114958415 [Acropora millepora]|nr:uncharacterized protein LOC114958415 [Acropora millepora]